MSHTRAKGGSEQVLVLGVPTEGGYRQLLGLLIGEAPQGQQRALIVTVLIRRVLPVLEICNHISTWCHLEFPLSGKIS